MCNKIMKFFIRMLPPIGFIHPSKHVFCFGTNSCRFLVTILFLDIDSFGLTNCNHCQLVAHVPRKVSKAIWWSVITARWCGSCDQASGSIERKSCQCCESNYEGFHSSQIHWWWIDCCHKILWWSWIQVH